MAYTNASYEYFGREHLPYGILALLVSYFFLLLPVLLFLLYPLKIFRRYFGHWQALRFFMDSFQGSFIDGVTEGRYDCRYFSAVYLITRIVTMVTYAVSLSAYFTSLSIIQFMMLVLIIVIIKPYKKKLSVYGTIDVMFVMHMSLTAASSTGVQIAISKEIKSLGFAVFLLGIIILLPLLYIPLLLLLQLWTRRRKCMNHAFPCLKQHQGLHLLSSSEDEDDYDYDVRGNEIRRINRVHEVKNYSSLS